MIEQETAQEWMDRLMGETRNVVVCCLPQGADEGVRSNRFTDDSKVRTTVAIKGIPGVDSLKITLPEIPEGYYVIDLHENGVLPEDRGLRHD